MCQQIAQNSFKKKKLITSFHPLLIRIESFYEQYEISLDEYSFFQIQGFSHQFIYLQIEVRFFSYKTN